VVNRRREAGLAGGGVPYLSDPIVTGGDNFMAIGAKSDVIDVTLFESSNAPLFKGVGIPNMKPLPVTGYEAPTVRAKGDIKVVPEVGGVSGLELEVSRRDVPEIRSVTA
jgi:hypothetical protein